MSDRMWGFLLAALGVVWIWDGWRLQQEARSTSMFDALGPDRYLILLGGILLVSGLALVVGHRTPVANRPAEGNVAAGPFGPAFSLTLCVAAYALAIPWLGYGPSTFLYFLAAFYFAGNRNWIVTVAASAVSGAAFYVLFVRLATMPLPRGVVGF